MRLKISVILLLLGTVFGSAVSAKEITIGMGNFEPYYIAKGQTGIFADIITAVFKRLPDHEPKFVFGSPNNRLWQDFKKRKVDAVSNLFDSVEIDGCRSDPVFRFRDVAVTQKISGIAMKDIADLQGRKIIAFQGAKDFFGQAFSAVAEQSSYYEVSEPRLQAQALIDRRVEVSIGDLFIFLSSLQKMTKNRAEPTAFRFHDILPVTYSRMGFHDVQLCQDFNAALKQVRDSGEYEEIYKRYLNILGHSPVPGM